ncbi:MAG: hypothetical protein ACKVQC_02450 [Elusimicrobiota bacterium]
MNSEKRRFPYSIIPATFCWILWPLSVFVFLAGPHDMAQDWFEILSRGSIVCGVGGLLLTLGKNVSWMERGLSVLLNVGLILQVVSMPPTPKDDGTGAAVFTVAQDFMGAIGDFHFDDLHRFAIDGTVSDADLEKLFSPVIGEGRIPPKYIRLMSREIKNPVFPYEGRATVVINVGILEAHLATADNAPIRGEITLHLVKTRDRWKIEI